MSDCVIKDFPYLSAVDLILDYAFLFDSFCKIATMCLKYVLCVDKCDIKKYISYPYGKYLEYIDRPKFANDTAIRWVMILQKL